MPIASSRSGSMAARRRCRRICRRPVRFRRHRRRLVRPRISPLAGPPLQRIPNAHWYTAMFLERGLTPYTTMLLFFWALGILFLKSQKLRIQTQTLNLSAVPQEPDFLLNRESARAVLTRIHSLVDDASHFLLLNRIERALSNLKNIGQISDVASILRNQADYDEQQKGAAPPTSARATNTGHP